MKVAKILAVAALLVAGSAQAAGYTTFEYHDETKRSDDSTKQKMGVVVGNKLQGGLDYSVKLDVSQAEWGNGDIGSGIEARVRQNFSNIGIFTPFAGVRLGQKLESDNKFSHYAVDAGLKFPLVGALSGEVGYRYRDAFSSANAFNSNRYHTTISYAISKYDSVGLRYSQAYGTASEEKNAYRLTWTRNF